MLPPPSPQKVDAARTQCQGNPRLRPMHRCCAGTSFPNFESFEESFSKRGVGALEMLAVEMKLAGMYVARGLSYQTAEFETAEVSLTPEHVTLYNNATALWNDIRIAFGMYFGDPRPTGLNPSLRIEPWQQPQMRPQPIYCCCLYRPCCCCCCRVSLGVVVVFML